MNIEHHSGVMIWSTERSWKE